jgi:hypothetical protein
MIGRRPLIWWLGLGLLGALSGCGGAVSRRELPGTYMADYGFATDTLTIDGDGRYIQIVRVKATGKVATASGTWRFSPQDQHIGLDGMMVVADYAGKPIPDFERKKDAIVDKPVARWFGRLQIGDDPAVPYYKQAKGP